MLRATTVCTLSTSQLPKVLRHGRALFRHLNFKKCSEHGVFLRILICKCASRHNGVQLLISHLARWLRTRRFPTFRPPGATNHWKNTVIRDFPIFSRTCIFFFSLFLFSDLLSSALLLSDSSHLCFFSSLTLPTSAFSSVHNVGSLTSKQTSNIPISIHIILYMCVFLKLVNAPKYVKGFNFEEFLYIYIYFF